MAIRECDCREFQDSGHTDECNEHYKPKADNYETPEDYKARMESDMDDMQAHWNKAWRHKRRWIIVEEGDGTYSVHEHMTDGVAPPITKPNKRDAAARLLQCMQLGPVAPQDYPEEICVGEITYKPADVIELNPSRRWMKCKSRPQYSILLLNHHPDRTLCFSVSDMH